MSRTADAGRRVAGRLAPLHAVSARDASKRGASTRRSEAGQITVLVVIFTICLLIAVVAVTDISASYLRRQAATSLADGAALAATGAAADVATVYRDSEPDFVALDPAAAAASVESYLTQTGAYGSFPGLASSVVVEGATVTVSLTMPYQLPVRMPGVDATTIIHSTGSAQLPIY